MAGKRSAAAAAWSAIVHGDAKALAEVVTSAEIANAAPNDFALLSEVVLIEAGTAEMIALLVERGADVAHADPKRKYTALHFAARDGKEAIARALIAAGAPIDAIDDLGLPPISHAIGHIPLVEVLVAAGANLDVRGTYPGAKTVRELGEAQKKSNPALAAALRGEQRVVVPYSAKGTFAVGARISHPTFGEGTVMKLLPDKKLEVGFASGTRALVHQR